LVRPCPASRLSFSFFSILTLTLTAGCGGGGGASSGGDDPPPSISAPTIDSIDLKNGPVHGGFPVKILGNDFSSGMQLTIGGLALECMHVLDSSTVVGVTPPGLEGLADVKATNSKGSDTLEDGFEFHEGPWQLCGMQGGKVNAIAVDPSDPLVMYMGTDAGLLKSTSGGKQWSPLLEDVDSGTARVRIISILIDPVDTSTIYAGRYGQLLKSVDAGATWIETSGGIKAGECTAFDPSDSRVLYAGGFGLYKSLDAGETWTQIDSGFDSNAVRVVVVDPFETDTVFAGTNDGVYRSTDAGDTWVRVDPALGYNSGLALDPLVPGHLLAAMSGNLYESSDWGGTWSLVEDGLPSGSDLVAFDPSTPGSVYVARSGSMYKRVAGSDSWFPINSGLLPSSIQAIGFDSAESETLLVGTFEALQASTDGGLTWTRLDEFRSVPFVTDVCVDPSTPDTVYACSSGSAQKSADGGKSWVTIADAQLLSSSVFNFNAIAVDPINGDLFLGTSHGIHKSNDGGESWTDKGLSFVTRIVINPLDTTIIYAGTQISGLHKSTDSGDTWVRVDSGFTGERIMDVTLDPVTPQTIYASCTGAESRIYRSLDEGATWTQASGDFGVWVLDIEIAPLQPQTLYAATYFGGLFKSSDMGGSWTRIDAGFPTTAVFGVAVDPQDPSVLYASSHYALMSSNDAGASWTKAIDAIWTAYLPGSSHYLGITFDSLDSDTFYLGTTAGLIKTTTAGL